MYELLSVTSDAAAAVLAVTPRVTSWWFPPGSTPSPPAACQACPAGCRTGWAVWRAGRGGALQAAPPRYLSPPRLPAAPPRLLDVLTRPLVCLPRTQAGPVWPCWSCLGRTDYSAGVCRTGPVGWGAEQGRWSDAPLDEGADWGGSEPRSGVPRPAPRPALHTGAAASACCRLGRRSCTAALQEVWRPGSRAGPARLSPFTPTQSHQPAKHWYVKKVIFIGLIKVNLFFWESLTRCRLLSQFDGSSIDGAAVT